MEKGIMAQTAALIVVVGIVSFGGGFMIAGGPETLAQQYTIGENITVNVKAPGENTYTQVTLNSGMTVLDAVANVYEIRTDLSWPQFGPAVKTIDNQWLTVKVNGETPPVGMAAYQLEGGENIELAFA